MSEAQVSSVDAYDSLEAVFTRRLKDNARPIGRGLVSPADGVVVYSRALTGNRMIQAKGLWYSIDELIYGPQREGDGFKPGHGLTVYLAPDNYHRVHAPLAGTLTVLRYVPGELWPVNQLCARIVPSLFCRNERLVFEFVTSEGDRFVLVMVGALNVGRMVSPFWPHFATNSREQVFGAGLASYERAINTQVAKGDELGTFMLGSTVVLVFDDALRQKLALTEVNSAKPVKMGESFDARMTQDD